MVLHRCRRVVCGADAARQVAAPSALGVRAFGLITRTHAAKLLHSTCTQVAASHTPT